MSMAVKGATSVQRSIPGIGFQGDPGLFGFLGDVGKTLGRAAIGGLKGFASGGPFGVFSGALGGVLGRKTAKPRQLGQAGMGVNGLVPFTGRMPISFAPGVGRQQPRPGVIGRIQRALPGGATGMMPVQNGGGPPGPGYHINKSDYFLKDGTFIPKGSMWVKNRRRNPLNPRALSRAMSRLTSAKNAAKALGRITIRKEC